MRNKCKVVTKYGLDDNGSIVKEEDSETPEEETDGFTSNVEIANTPDFTTAICMKAVQWDKVPKIDEELAKKRLKKLMLYVNI